MLLPPLCEPVCSLSCLLATRVDPGDLQELFQQTSASVFRINSNGESVVGPASPLPTWPPGPPNTPQEVEATGGGGVPTALP